MTKKQDERKFRQEDLEAFHDFEQGQQTAAKAEKINYGRIAYKD